MTADLRCTYCNGPLSPGGILIVTPTDGSSVFYVHRHAISPSCIRAAGHRGQATIALPSDPGAGNLQPAELLSLRRSR